MIHPSRLARAFRSGTFRMAAVALCFTGSGHAQTTAKADPPVAPVVTGKFTGNGKPGAIKFVVVEDRESFGGEPAIRILFSEVDPAKSKKPSFDAMFGKLGDSLNLSLDYKGGIFGCEVYHNAHEKKGFSSVGVIKTTDFKIAGGNVSGRVTTDGERDAFGEKWEVDLTFAAPLPESLRKGSPAASEKEPAEKPAAEMPAKPAPPEATPLSVYMLPIPNDAKDLEFRKIVGQIHFSSPRPVAEVSKEFSADLKQQGWQDGRGNLETKASSILKRELGAAKLTIMIQPSPPGSTVKIFTEGLDWSENGGVAQ